MIVEINKHPNGKDLEAEVDKNGCWNVTSHKTSLGYPVYKQERVHRYMYKKYHGEIPEGMVVRHKCDNKMCCNPEHFELGTQLDNAHDFIFRQGGNYILTKQQIFDILKDTRKTREIAECYNVSKDVVCQIRNGQRTILKGKKSEVLDKVKKNKLSKVEVLQIYESEEDVSVLADKYKVSKWTIWDIKNGHTWSKITGHKKGEQ